VHTDSVNDLLALASQLERSHSVEVMPLLRSNVHYHTRVRIASERILSNDTSTDLSLLIWNYRWVISSSLNTILWLFSLVCATYL